MADPYADPLTRYQIMEPLGRGGTGTTFRAIDRATSRTVAVKVLSLRTIDGDWKRFDRFEREAEILAALAHPSIPRYIDHYASESTGDYFLVMELVEGTPLGRRIIEGRPVEPAALRDVLEQGLSILEYLHSRSPPVIHRDIKPANLLLDPGGRLHLVDFGGVRRVAQAGGSTTMIGTFGYMAPEQLHGEASAATDLYALGATIAALHAGVEAEALAHDGLQIDLSALAPPPALAPALERMLVPDPKQRARSVDDVRRALHPGSRPRDPSAARTESSPEPALGAAVPRPAVRPEPASLVPVDGLRELARVPAPLSIVVWILTALGAGSATVFQVLLMPLVFHLARRVSRGRSDSRRAELEHDLARFEKTVIDARRSLAYVAGRTHPLRDDDAER